VAKAILDIHSITDAGKQRRVARGVWLCKVAGWLNDRDEGGHVIDAIGGLSDEA